MPPIQKKSMPPASRRQSVMTTQDLTAAQSALLQAMREYQFGRIENMPVQAGQPLLDKAENVVRVTLLGGDKLATTVQDGKEFELKKAVRDLFDELERLDDGTVVRLEFKRGLPCLLETAAAAIDDRSIAPAAAECREG